MTKARRKSKAEEQFEEENYERKLMELPIEQDEIPVKSINPGKRIREDYGDISELMHSLENKGLIQPLAVMKYEEPFSGFDYFLLVGGRRLRAIKELGWEKVAVRIYPPGLNAFEIRSIELEENLRRKDMTDAERLKNLSEIHDHWVSIYGKKDKFSGWSLKDTAKRLNISHSGLHQDIQLAEYLKEVPELGNLKDKEAMKKAIKAAKKEVKVQTKIQTYEESVKDKDEAELKDLYVKSYIIGDFFTKVKAIPDKSIDFINHDIDFPVDTDENQQHGGIREDKQKGTYIGVLKEDYPGLMRKSLLECYRVMKEDSWLIVWFGREYFKQIQEWGEEAGFRVSWYTGRWYQGQGYASTQTPYYKLGNTIQEFFYFAKGSPTIQLPHPDVFECPPDPIDSRTNKYQKPILLMDQILSTFIDAGSKVLDCFTGSGHCLIAAFKNKCTAVGFDLSNDQKNGYKAEVYTVL